MGQSIEMGIEGKQAFDAAMTKTPVPAKETLQWLSLFLQVTLLSNF